MHLGIKEHQIIHTIMLSRTFPEASIYITGPVDYIAHEQKPSSRGAVIQENGLYANLW